VKGSKFSNYYDYFFGVVNLKLVDMKMKYAFTLVLLCTLSIALTKGQPIQDFKLNSVTNNDPFILHDARGKFVALHFLLKTECPVCIRHTMEYFNNQDRLPEVIQVFIKPDTEEEIQMWAKNLSMDELDHFSIYRDPGAELAKTFNIPYGYEFHNQVVHFPALVLIDPEGHEVFRYIGKNNRDRYSFDQLEAKIKELVKK
jgi:peroxiredoxin Q/BCP